MSAERRSSGADRRKQALALAGGDRRSPEGDRRAGPRLAVQKTWKMVVGGAFVRSESGRVTKVTDAAGRTKGETHTVSRASRKDARDAVNAALAAWPGWSARTAYNRGQIVYRLAEVMEARADELSHALVRHAGVSAADARREVEATINRTVAWAGWADKLVTVLSHANPVSGPHFDFTVPEPMGVVALVAPASPSLLGLVSTVLPIVTAGNTVVALASEADPRTAIVLGEALATSDFPGGVVNLLTGQAKEVAPHLARHVEVAALDLWTPDAALVKSLSELAAESVKRVRVRALPADAWFDAARTESVAWAERFVEAKTIWHPVGV